MKYGDALWLYNDLVAPAVGGEDNLTNVLTVFGGAVIGAGAPTVIYTGDQANQAKGRFHAAQFLRMWADAIEGKGGAG